MEHRESDPLVEGVIWGGLLTVAIANPLLGGAAIAAKLGWSWWKKTAPARQVRRERRHQLRLEKERRKAVEAELKHRERLLRREQKERAKLPPPPPPPTREELAAAARERFDATLRMLAAAHIDGTELQAGQLRAKQQYLRELERLME
jgi:hypothetical protein